MSGGRVGTSKGRWETAAREKEGEPGDVLEAHAESVLRRRE